jgi:hypothetical protein
VTRGNVVNRYERILKRVKNELGQQNSQKAIRILEWIACSFRVLKLYEVQDGIVFDKLGTILDEDSKMNARILDLCKPLVQDGPNNTVEFVHFSAKEQVLSSDGRLLLIISLIFHALDTYWILKAAI